MEEVGRSLPATHVKSMLRSAMLCLVASTAISTALHAQDTPNATIHPGSPAYLDSLDGFRGVKFGTEFGKFTGLVLDQDRGKLKLYTKKSEDLTLGLAKLSTIVYHFFDGKLQAVTIHTTSMPDGRTLVAIANSGFGAGTKLDPYNTIWQGETAWAQLSQNEQTGEVTLTLGDAEISRDLGNYEQQQAQEAAAQL